MSADTPKCIPHAVRNVDVPVGGWQLRLGISIPALLMLFMLGFGLISYQLFASRWYELQRAGAEPIARDLLRWHLYTMLILTGAALASGLGLAFTILKPIESIIETAKSIASGRLDQRAPHLPAARELGDLSRSFNSMIDYVNESIQERNRHLVEGILTGVLTASLDGAVSALNSAGARILGVDSAQVVGKNVRDLRESMPRKHRPFWNYIENALSSETTAIPSELSFADPESESKLIVATAKLKDASGVPFAVMVNFRDVAEMKSFREHLSKTDQLAALGTFTMGLAHELRNPLGAIKGMMQLLQLAESTPPDTADIVHRVVREVDRLDSFIRELLDFSSQSPAPPELTDTNEVLRAAARLAQRDSVNADDKNIELVFDLADVPPILAEGDRLAQALGNIVRNAYEAASPGSTITLRSRLAEGDDREIEIIVHNTGSSIDAASRSKIFDPFFTTKERGSGLGLPIAYQIVSQNNGTLDVASGPDDVTFILRFPLSDENKKAGAPAPRAVEHR